MSVIGVNGSPRPDGNTGTLVKAILHGAADAGAETRLFQLGEMTFSGCRACMGCRATGVCTVIDDLTAFHDAVDEGIGARGLVIGTPIYWDHVSGQVKSWLDRLFCYTNNEIGENTFPTGYRAVLVATWDWDRADGYMPVLEWLRERLARYLGIAVVETLMLHNTGASPIDQHPELLARARELGRRLGAA
jgi:multimeric flavodoxin WrbA